LLDYECYASLARLTPHWNDNIENRRCCLPTIPPAHSRT